MSPFIHVNSSIPCHSIALMGVSRKAFVSWWRHHQWQLRVRHFVRAVPVSTVHRTGTKSGAARRHPDDSFFFFFLGTTSQTCCQHTINYRLSITLHPCEITMKKTVRFDTNNVTTHEIPALDGRSIRSGELFYSRRDIESFIAVHYMEEMIGLLAFVTEESTQNHSLVSMLMGFGTSGVIPASIQSS